MSVTIKNPLKDSIKACDKSDLIENRYEKTGRIFLKGI